jgi:hypothetical protein
LFDFEVVEFSVNERDKIRVRVLERRILRKISGPLRTGEDTWRTRSNAELDHINSGADIVRFIKGRRIRRIWHIPRMDFSTID